MAQTLKTHGQGVETPKPSRSSTAPERRGVEKEKRPIDRFLSELRRMTPQERIRGSRYSFNDRERWVYAANYPEEVPCVNGELEWIALTLE